MVFHQGAVIKVVSHVWSFIGVVSGLSSGYCHQGGIRGLTGAKLEGGKVCRLRGGGVCGIFGNGRREASSKWLILDLQMTALPYPTLE